MGNVLETHNLTKRYGQHRGIEDVSLSVNEGDFFGFIGPNGAGKSTTIRTLLGLIQATSGSAEIFGKDIVKYKNEILSDIGYMPSESMFYKLKVSELIKLSADLHKKDCSEEAAYLCNKLQLDVNRKASELSLGNRKKVSIVCAMQHQPKLYIFDEPTSGLDPLIQQEFFEILHNRREKGATILFSSHILSEVQRYCNRAAIIREGKLIACDSIDKLSGAADTVKVSLKGINIVPDVEGIKNIAKTDDVVSFFYQGDIKKLISVINEMPVTGVNISEPDLEEIFMHFYEGGNK